MGEGGGRKKVDGGECGERKVGRPSRRQLHDGIKSFVGINDNDDNEAACHRRLGRAIIVRRRISQSLLLEIFSSPSGFATMSPFFSSDRQTMSSFLPFFVRGSKFRRKKRKVSKDRPVGFFLYINIFKEISSLVLHVGER